MVILRAIDTVPDGLVKEDSYKLNLRARGLTCLRTPTSIILVMGGTATDHILKSVNLASCPKDKTIAKNAVTKPWPTVIRYKNDIGIWKIYVGQKQFICIGVSAPHDHPHIYLQMGDANSIICPYCATHYSYLRELKDDETDPAGCVEVTSLDLQGRS